MAAKKTGYEPDTRYSVKLSKVVEHDGFVFSPNESPVMKGELLSQIPADAVVEAEALPPLPEPATPPTQIKEHADGRVTVVNPT